MQSTKTERQTVQPGPSERFILLRGWMRDKGISNYMSVFAVLDLSSDEAEQVRSWWQLKANPTTEDIPLIKRLERVIDLLKKAA